MTSEEYNNKKRECWEKVKFAFSSPNTDRKTFDFIFDRAYALGKLQANGEQVNETITQEEIEKVADTYAGNAYYPAPDYGWYESDDRQMKEVLVGTFKAGANYALSRQTASQNQWIRVEDGLPEDRQLILFCYQSYHKGRYITLYTTERFDADMGFASGVIKQNLVLAWMPVSEFEIK